MDIYRFVKYHPNVSVSFDPTGKPLLQLVTSDSQSDSEELEHGEDESWLELLSDGLTFDLTGLAPGKHAELPPYEQRFDFDKGMAERRRNAICLRPGAHILGASGAVPVLKSLLRLARDLIQHFENVEAVVWPHSECVIGRRFFESSVTAYLEGGPFPALGLVSFRETVDGGIQSVGLAHLIGQELRIEPELAADKLVATRLGVRLINQLVLTGPVEQTDQVAAPDGRVIRLEPSPNARFIRVWSS